MDVAVDGAIAALSALDVDPPTSWHQNPPEKKWQKAFYRLFQFKTRRDNGSDQNLAFYQTSPTTVEARPIEARPIEAPEAAQ